MRTEMTRRSFVKDTLLASTTLAIGLGAQAEDKTPPAAETPTPGKLPKG